MVTILREVSGNLPIDKVWKPLRQVGPAYRRRSG